MAVCHTLDALKNCCTTARKTGHKEYPACLGIHDIQTGKLLLIEATPAIEAQVSMLHTLAGISPPQPMLDALLITHAHIGHYAGLLQLGKEGASTNAIPTYVTKKMAEFLSTNAPWSQLVQNNNIELKRIDESESFSPLEGLTVEAIQVPHRDDFSDTVAFKLHGPKRTIVFVPDIDTVEENEQLIEQLLDGVDVAYIDATFYDDSELPSRDMSQIPHPLMIHTMEQLQDVAHKNPGMIRFIHLNHSNPALHDRNIQQNISELGYKIAEQGELIEL